MDAATPRPVQTVRPDREVVTRQRAGDRHRNDPAEQENVVPYDG